MEKEQIGNDNVMVIDLVQLMQALWHRAWAILLAILIFGGQRFPTPIFLLRLFIKLAP